MNSSDNPFQQQLEFGREVEKRVARWFMLRSFHVLPVYDYTELQENKAPKLTAYITSDSLVSPDLQLAKAGCPLWLEVKYKQRADWTRLTRRYETGISLRLWDDYCQVEEITGIPVAIVFVHEKEDRAVIATMSQLKLLKPRTYTGYKMAAYGMIFFPFDQLNVLSSATDVIGDLSVRN
ncbi:hypothetical protein ACFL2Q_11555 [Thermodesulfobacteriota bacterium]